MFNVHVIDRADNGICDRYETVAEARADYPDTEQFDVQVWSGEEVAEREEVFAMPEVPAVS